MSKNTKIVVGVLTLLPLIGIFFYIGLVISFIGTQGDGFAPDGAGLSKNIIWMVSMVGLSILLGIGLLIFYIVHAVNNKKLDSNERIIWILLFFFFSNIAFMIYWVLRIWQDKDGEVPTTRSEFLDAEI